MKMRQKAMISQPMKGASRDDILVVRECATEFLAEWGYDVEDTFLLTMVLYPKTRKTYLQRILRNRQKPCQNAMLCIFVKAERKLPIYTQE